MRKPDELLTVEEVAVEIKRGTATVWNLARDHDLPRYKLPARGKTTFFRWGDVQQALNTPIPKPTPPSDE